MKRLILARVVLGVCAEGCQGMRDTPPGAHSLVDRLANPGIFVVQVPRRPPRFTEAGSTSALHPRLAPGTASDGLHP